MGFRDISLAHNVGAPDGSLPYTFVVNGKPLYAKGVNWVPLDERYGCITPARYREAVALLAAAHVNLVRVWGGGLIESETFYDLCDEFGILVWQEFPQSTGGIDGVPSKRSEFLQKLERVAVEAVSQKRNHACMAAWSGGNELSTAPAVPITFDDVNVAMLRGVVAAYQPGAAMLPSSPSGPSFFGDCESPGRNHDVHGQWLYLGTEAHYAYYNALDSQLHSEFGVNGMMCAANLSRFLSRKHLKVTDTRRDLVWRHHGEWWDSYERETSLFGEPASLEEFSLLSQFIQSEGLRYTLEANRRRAFANSGSIVWQFDEPFPNVFCTSLVDYYGTPKLAYYGMQKAYSPLNVSAEYGSLVYEEGGLFRAGLYVVSDRRGEAEAEYVLSTVEGETLAQGRAVCCLPVCGAVKCAEIERSLPPFCTGLVLSLRAAQGELLYRNRLLFLVRQADGKCRPQTVIDFVSKEYEQAKFF